jgi:hypothetical protein
MRVQANLSTVVQHWREGIADRMFGTLLAAAVADCNAAPDIKKPRRITVTFDVTPLNVSDGSIDDVAFDIQMGSSVPKRLLTGTMLVGLGSNNNSLVFEAATPDSDPRQRPLFDGPPEPPVMRSPADDDGDQDGNPQQ